MVAWTEGMENDRTAKPFRWFGAWAFSLASLLGLFQPFTARGQDDSDLLSAAAVSSTPDPGSPNGEAWVVEQISRLGSSNYRTRLSARAKLEERPMESLLVLQENIHRVDVVVGVQLVEILSGLAMHSDIRVSGIATHILTSTADDATSVGRAAANSLSAIADLQEEKAWQVLTEQGAYIGPQNFSINGRLSNMEGPLSLRIDDQFSGSDEDFDWIRYLKTIKVVYLRGPRISVRALEAVSQLKNVQAIKLRSIALTSQQLLLFRDLHALEHLGLSYMDVDDSFIANIMQLPISHSIRLYGTKVTADGEQQLVKQFDGLEIFRGSGGFLGISSLSTRQAQVEQVTPDSAASRAGIQHGDIITAINGNPIQTFEQLRIELGKYEADETVAVRLTRIVSDGLNDQLRQVELTVQATLQEESN